MQWNDTDVVLGMELFKILSVIEHITKLLTSSYTPQKTNSSGGMQDVMHREQGLAIVQH